MKYFFALLSSFPFPKDLPLGFLLSEVWILIPCIFFSNPCEIPVDHDWCGLISLSGPDLQHDVADDDHEGVGEVEQEPHLHGLDVRGAGERGGDGEVDRGQHHHARDVHLDDQLVLQTADTQLAEENIQLTTRIPSPHSQDNLLPG